MRHHLSDQIDPTVLGASLRAARKAAGLTQQAVATELGLARTTVVAIEKGARAVRAGDIVRFADLYQRPVPELVGRRQTTGGFEAQFRAQQSHSPIPRTEFARAVYELQTLAESYFDLESLLDEHEQRQFPPEYASEGVSFRHAGAGIAANERNRLSLGDGPLGNLRDRLEADSGLRIFHFDMPSKLAGLFVFHKKLGPCVAINANHPTERRHWTLAHEYGHFLMHRFRADATVLDTRCLKARRERLADTFAEHFLMPSAGLNSRFSEIKRNSQRGVTVADLVRLAHLYRVSFQAMVIRLETLRRIPLGTWNRLKADRFKTREAQRILGLNVQIAIENRFPRRYVSLAVQAYRKALLSEEQLARLLRTHRIETRLVVERYERSIHGEDDGKFLVLQLDSTGTITGR